MTAARMTERIGVGGGWFDRLWLLPFVGVGWLASRGRLY